MRVMAIDYGDRRTGLAFSDLTNTLVGDAFTVEEYEALYQQMVDGTLVVDDDYSKLETTEWSNVTLNVI